MKLQISFDIPDLKKCLEIAKQVEPYCDRFEICSILMYKYGVEAITKFREAFPDKELLAETQIVERGKDITNICLNAGADWITVMAGANKEVIHNVCSTAGSKKNVMLDLSDTTLLGQACMDAKTLGVDGILFHKPYEQSDQPVMTLEQWEIVRGNTQLPIYVAANFDRETVKRVILLKPNGIVMSRSITEHENPAQEAEHIYNLIQNPTKSEGEEA